MRVFFAASIVMLLALGIISVSHAEYVIYLKGGHYIVADACTYVTRQELAKEPDSEREKIFIEDCTKGNPEGPIYWSTIDGRFGEIDADNVYLIFGSKNLPSIKPTRKTRPFEDYLITNRGESFVNAKIFEDFKEEDRRIFTLKRDELSNIYRRGIRQIVPEADVISRSGEGLCPGERAEFDVNDTKPFDDQFIGTFTNLSRGSCMEVSIEVEVSQGGEFKGTFPIKVSGAVPPNGTKRFSVPIDKSVKKYVEQFLDREAGIQLCYRKVQSLSQCEADIRQQTKP
jgi:hypothetical protein